MVAPQTPLPRFVAGGSALLLAVLSGCSSLPPGAQARLRVFETYTEALANHYPFFAQKHIDWEGLTTAYRSAVVAAEEPSQFYHLLTGLLAELDDPHVSLSIPARCWHSEAGPATVLTDLPGLRIAAFDRRFHVLAWPEGRAPIPPAHLPASLQNYPELTRVEGARVTLPLVGKLLRGRAGSVADLQLRWADGTLTRHTLRRPATTRRRTTTIQWEGETYEVEVEPIPKNLEQVASYRPHGGFALLRLATLDPSDCSADLERFKKHLDTLLTAADEQEGLILDLRDNPGGKAQLMAHFLGRFLTHPVDLVNDVELREYFFGLLQSRMFRRVVFDPRAPRYTRPIVVLTSWRTGSAAEILAQLLQREAGAVVIGEQTIGAEASLVQVEGGDGTTLTFGSVRSLDASGVGFQDEGITPDISVRLRLDDVRRDGSFDTAWKAWEQRMLRAAERQLETMVARTGQCE